MTWPPPGGPASEDHHLGGQGFDIWTWAGRAHKYSVCNGGGGGAWSLDLSQSWYPWVSVVGGEAESSPYCSIVPVFSSAK